MAASPTRVILDACVLYPFTLRDTLLRMAAEGMYQLCWSAQILEETRRNLVAKQITEEQATRLLAAMTSAFPDAMVTDYEALTPKMKNEPEDRHVVAAAVTAGADIIVTSNLRHFHDLPDGLQAQSPDAFLLILFNLDPEVARTVVHQQAAALKRPPRSFDDVLNALAKSVPTFTEAVRLHARITSKR